MSNGTANAPLTLGNDDLESSMDKVISKSSPATRLVSNAEKKRADEMRKLKLEAVLETWQKAAANELDTRKTYAVYLLWLLAAQALALNIAFFMIGRGYLEIDEVTARVYVVGVFSELAAMVFWIVKYLFSRSDEPVLKLIEKL